MEKIKRFLKNEFVKLILIGVVINALCFVFGTCYAKASSTQGALPYFVTYGLNYPIETYIDLYNNNAWGTMYPVDWTRPEILAYSVDDGSVVNTYFFVPIDANATYEVNLRNIPYQNFDYTTQYLEITFIGLRQDKWYCLNYKEYQNGTVVIYGFDNFDTVRFFGSGSFSYPKFLNGGTYFQTNLNGVQDNPVLISNYDAGEPLPPEWDDNLPNKPTQPNTPTPPTMPTINDISDLGNWLLSLFSWLIGVISNWFSYIADLLEWLFTKLANTIKQGFENIFNNFKNFFKPIFDNLIELIGNVKDILQNITQTIQHFFDPFDFNQAETQLNNSSAITSIRGIVTNIKTFANVFTNTNEPDNLTFTLDFTQNSFFNFGLCTLDFNVIKPFRSAIRLIIGCLLVFGLIVTISTSINSYIGGNSSKNEG